MSSLGIEPRFPQPQCGVLTTVRTRLMIVPTQIIFIKLHFSDLKTDKNNHNIFIDFGENDTWQTSIYMKYLLDYISFSLLKSGVRRWSRYLSFNTGRMQDQVID